MALVALTHDQDQMTNTAKQGPMTAHQLREVLAAAHNRQADRAARSGTKGTGIYYEAWLWLTAQTLGMKAIAPLHPFPWEPWERESITRTICNIQDLVALDDPC